MVNYYDESTMTLLRDELEEEVLAWEDVAPRRKFGCPAYQVDGNLFGFLVTDGLVLTRCPPKVREQLEHDVGAGSFESGPVPVEDWVQVPVREPGSMHGLMEAVKASYEEARAVDDGDDEG